MIKIIGGRGTGKTTKLIEVSAKENIPILCVDKMKKYHIMERAAEMGASIPTPLVFKEDSLKAHVDVLVDDLDFFLSCLFEAYGYKIKGYTISKDDLGVELYEI